MLVQGMYNRRKKGDKEPELGADKDATETETNKSSEDGDNGMCDGCADE